MDDLLSDFLTETAESLAAAESQLVRWEAEPRERESLHAVLRMLHGVKGSSGVLGLHRLASLAHALEGLFTRLRDGAQAASETVTLALSALDQLGEVLRELELFGAEPEGDDRGLIARLDSAARRELQPRPWPQRPPPPEEVDSFKAVFVDDPPLPEPQPAAPEPPGVMPEPPAPSPAAKPAAVRSVRVGAGVLDELMAQVSELVLTRNQLLQVIRTTDDTASKAPLQRLSVLTGELQESVLKTRMQPVGELWRTLPRVVRDLAEAAGKRLEVVTAGEAVELDREVLERLREPLLHLLRNSADHGVEPAAERRALGKPETGRIEVSARHEGGCAAITVADDGRGLDTRRIRERAVARGLVSATAAAGMTDAEAHRFIFSPGFSTAEAATGLSGRGVGLDAVRAQVEAMGGELDAASETGRGVRFTLRIPLSLSIVSALVVEAGGHRFALPQLNVQAVMPAGSPREGDRVPRLELAAQLQLPADPEGPTVLVHGGGRVFALGVGRMLEPEEVVVKPFARVLDGKPAYAGATLLGDGSVALVLNPVVLADAAVPQPVEPALAERHAAAASPADAGGRRVLLIDGDAMFREMLASLLTAAGCQVLTAASAEEAWRLHQDAFDAVVSDIDASGAEGPRSAAGVGGDRRWAEAALIALTALPVGAGLSSGADGVAVVRKADREGLLHALEQALAARLPAAA